MLKDLILYYTRAKVCTPLLIHFVFVCLFSHLVYFFCLHCWHQNSETTHMEHIWNVALFFRFFSQCWHWRQLWTPLPSSEPASWARHLERLSLTGEPCLKSISGISCLLNPYYVKKSSSSKEKRQDVIHLRHEAAFKKEENRCFQTFDWYCT